MHTKESLIEELEKLKINKDGTLLVHSSLKSIGDVEGGADTVLDALSEYMKNGLLVLPTHTWAYINKDNPKYYVEDSPSCIGILPELFRKRTGVVRSLHPTHSVAALGQGNEEFVAGAEKYDTPCARGSAWWKLLDNKATIMLIGVDLRRNTFIHGVEEWMNIPGRMTDDHQMLYTVLGDGTEISVPSRRHCGDRWAEYFWKADDIFVKKGVMYIGKFGDATVRICDAESVANLLYRMLDIKPDLFSNNEPVSQEIYDRFMEL